MRSTLIAVIGFGLLACAFSNCSNASLEGLPPPPAPVADNKLAISGELCTQSPEDLVFPVRVLFLVDCSESMLVTDPEDPITGETGREHAVRETIEKLQEQGGDVKVSIIRFSSQAQPLTSETDENDKFRSYFTADLDEALLSVDKLGTTDRTTNYINALAEAYSQMRHELMNADQESMALTTYHVIMVTDGIPDVEGSEGKNNTTENIRGAVEDIIELSRIFHVSRMTVNTAFLSSGNAMVDIAAEKLLKMMAEVGEGTYRSFAGGGELNFLWVDLTSLQRIFTLKTLFVQNLNAAVLKEGIFPDSDGDGISDWQEEAILSDPLDPDSDKDGCHDGMEYRFRTSGLDPIDPGDCRCYVPDYCFDENGNGVCDCADGVPEGSCCKDEDGDGFCDCIDEDGIKGCDPQNYADQDGDGLLDCEERFSGTNRFGADTDGDGLVDLLEVRFGTAPDIYDIDEDDDWDAVPNGEEVKTSTLPGYANLQGRGDIAYRYGIEEVAGTAKNVACYKFKIHNITLTELISDDTASPTFGPGGQGYSKYNRVLVFAGEVPFDDPESYARFRVACVEASFRFKGNYKEPPSGLVQLEESDFVPLSEFDAIKHCVRP